MGRDVICRDCNLDAAGYMHLVDHTPECKHIDGARFCEACGTYWWREGNDSTWDVDGCNTEDCARCTAELETATDDSEEAQP